MSTTENPMRVLIDHELAEAAKSLPGNQQAAITCHLVLRFCGPMVGAIRKCPLPNTDGLYQFLTPAQTPDGKRATAEFTFHIDDVAAIAVQREVQESRLFRPS